MLSKTAYLTQLLVLSCLCVFCANGRAKAEDQPKLLDPNDPRLTFSFPIHSGERPFHFKVGLDKDGTINGVSVFREGQAQPFQTLPACDKFADRVNENWGWGDFSQLIAHADLNFDGFEDLELLLNYIPHLDKRLYCIFLWDSNAGQFRYSKDLSDISADIEADPKTKTLTTREDWQGGAWEVTTYRWNGGKLEEIEDDGLFGDWGLKPPSGECSFTYSCSRRKEGKMVTTLEKKVCTPEEMDDLPGCPAAVAPNAGASKGTPHPETKH